MTEAQFLAQVREAARWLGWRTYHTHDSRRSEAGFPDVVLVRPPSLICAELKTDSGRLTEAQRDWLEALAACDRVEATLWRPSHWAAIETRLNGITRDNARSRTPAAASLSSRPSKPPLSTS